MLPTLRPYITAAIVFIVLAGLSILIRRAKPLALTDQTGAIRPERWSAWLTIVGGGVMCLGGLAAFVFTDAGWSGVACALIGLAIAGFMAPSATSVHAVTWNAELIEGPSQTFGPTLGLSRTQIRWGDIARIGKTLTSYWYVEARDGRRIYWSYLYKGYGALTKALRRKRPELELPGDMI